MGDPVYSPVSALFSSAADMAAGPTRRWWSLQRAPSVAGWCWGRCRDQWVRWSARHSPGSWSRDWESPGSTQCHWKRWRSRHRALPGRGYKHRWVLEITSPLRIQMTSWCSPSPQHEPSCSMRLGGMGRGDGAEGGPGLAFPAVPNTPQL